MLKKILAICAALMIAPAAYARCTTHTYIIDGKYIICTICCYGNNCTTTCY
jgi:hypothetical protein